MKKTHWLKGGRLNGLRIVINGLENSIYQLRKNLDKIEWYDSLSLIEECEPIYGLSFIALQNCINSTIYDCHEDLNNQFEKYKFGTELNNSGRTDIELIVSLANYFKHRDHPDNLRGETAKTLSDFKIRYDKDVHIEDSPIFKGLEMFSDSYELSTLINSVEKWAEKLWNAEALDWS